MNNPSPQHTTYQRIDSLDLIRGIAIPAILIMNIYAMALPPIAYSVPTWVEGAGVVDMAVYIFQALFVESRFMSIFTMLFGTGLALQSDRALGRNLNPRPRLRRRLVWLLVFGLIHGLLLWYGDILTLYAIVGLLVLPALTWTVKRLMVVGVSLILVGQILMALVVWGSVATDENFMDVPALPLDAAAVAAARTEWTTLPARLSANAGEYLSTLAVGGPFVLFWHTAGVMMIGVALYRRGFFSRTDTWRGGIISLVSGFAIGVVVLVGRFAVGLETGAAQALFAAMMLAGVLMAIGYMSLLVPLAQRSGLVVRALRNTGKTAFTLYISQTVISLLIFGVLLRPWWGTWHRGVLLIYVLLYTALQIIFAHWWQTHRGMGPLEGLWRRLARVPDVKLAPTNN
jgi:uncharacterized protein